MFAWLKNLITKPSDPEPKVIETATMTEVVDHIIASLDEEAIAVIKSWQPDEAMPHHGFGTGIRNNYNPWDRNSKLSKWFQEHLGLVHGDDLSGIIMETVWAKVRNEYFDPFAEAEGYHRHWAAMGVDPMKEDV